MHGIIFAELKKFVNQGFGEAAWAKISRQAGVTRVSNLATESYPDEELFALVGAAEKLSGVPAQNLLLQFGEFIVPDLLKVFGAFVDKRWRALDMLENTESVIHRAVRLQDANAAPPQLRITRAGTDEVVIVYSSPRKLCAVAKGIIRGIAKHYGENLAIDEKTCMLEGAPECTLVTTRTASA